MFGRSEITQRRKICTILQVVTPYKGQVRVLRKLIHLQNSLGVPKAGFGRLLCVGQGGTRLWAKFPQLTLNDGCGSNAIGHLGNPQNQRIKFISLVNLGRPAPKLQDASSISGTKASSFSGITLSGFTRTVRMLYFFWRPTSNDNVIDARPFWRDNGGAMVFSTENTEIQQMEQRWPASDFPGNGVRGEGSSPC